MNVFRNSPSTADGKIGMLRSFRHVHSCCFSFAFDREGERSVVMSREFV